MNWDTRVTGLLNCKYPILQGALHTYGNWKLAAAVAETGAYGTITAAISKTPEKLRDGIKRCRDATSGSFGVNLTFSYCPRIEEMLEVCIEEKVPVETSAYKPDSLAPRIKEAGLKWLHKSARVKDALRAEHLGADAVIIVGLEGTGFKHPLQLPTLTTIVWAMREIKIPVIAAGGIADAHGFLGALAAGADAVMMGTAFLATGECLMSDAAKRAIVDAAPDDPQLVRRVLAPPDPRAWDEVMQMRDKVPLDAWLHMLERVNLKEPDWKIPWGEGDNLEVRLSKMVSLAAGSIDHVATVKELIDTIIREAEAIRNSRPIFK